MRLKNMSKKEKRVVSPNICAWDDDEHNINHIEITLHGVEKD